MVTLRSRRTTESAAPDRPHPAAAPAPGVVRGARATRSRVVAAADAAASGGDAAAGGGDRAVAFIKPPALSHLPHPLDTAVHSSPLNPWSEDSCRDYVVNVCLRRLDELPNATVRVLHDAAFGNALNTPTSSAGGASGGRGGVTPGSAGRGAQAAAASSAAGGDTPGVRQRLDMATPGERPERPPGAGLDTSPATAEAVTPGEKGAPAAATRSAPRQSRSPPNQHTESASAAAVNEAALAATPATKGTAEAELDRTPTEAPSAAAAEDQATRDAEVVDGARRVMRGLTNVTIDRWHVRQINFCRLLMLYRPAAANTEASRAHQTATSDGDDTAAEGSMLPPDALPPAGRSAAGGGGTPSRQLTPAPGNTTEASTMSAAALTGIPIVSMRKEPLLIALRNVYFDLLRVPHPSQQPPQQAVPEAVPTPTAADHQAAAASSGGADATAEGDAKTKRRRETRATAAAAAVAEKPPKEPEVTPAAPKGRRGKRAAGDDDGDAPSASENADDSRESTLAGRTRGGRSRRAESVGATAAESAEQLADQKGADQPVARGRAGRAKRADGTASEPDSQAASPDALAPASPTTTAAAAEAATRPVRAGKVGRPPALAASASATPAAAKTERPPRATTVADLARTAVRAQPPGSEAGAPLPMLGAAHGERVDVAMYDFHCRAAWTAAVAAWRACYGDATANGSGTGTGAGR